MHEEFAKLLPQNARGILISKLSKRTCILGAYPARNADVRERDFRLEIQTRGVHIDKTRLQVANVQ